ncbi:hypothetical protein [Qipengyuania sp. ASV99]|uniref:hypothetical protein n=1 Tax=Qipengyuania sp. ASV99 TaxID=3399681 RepID=UPI003A4C6CC8
MGEGELIVWQGMKLARVEPKGFAIYFFAIPWTAFALFWTAMAAVGTSAMQNGDTGLLGWAFPLFGTPFILIGLGMLAMPFVPMFQRGRILFAVTDKRVLQLSLGRDLTVNSVPSSRIGDIVRRESADGTGSVELSLSVAITDFGGRPSKNMNVGRVADVRGAYSAIFRLSEKD